MKNIMIANGVWHKDVTDMFINRGHKVVQTAEEADLVCFIGGEDVQPSLYGEHDHPSTHTNPARDEMEEKLFHYCLNEGIPMAGICRGAQFLNVMNGGKLYQDVDNHATGNTHLAFTYFSDN